MGTHLRILLWFLVLKEKISQIINTSKSMGLINPFRAIDFFYNPWKHQETFGFVVFLRSLERDH